MNSATISADIISYTSLSEGLKRKVGKGMEDLLQDLGTRYGKDDFFGRIVQGDYIECALKIPRHSLRIALILKSYLKSIEMDPDSGSNSRLKHFSDYGIRLAVAVAPLLTFDKERGIIDGEAIYLSGRAIKNYSTSGKTKVVIKNTMFFRSPDKQLEEEMDALFSLLDTILSKCSAKQSEVIFYKLLGLSEKEISQKLKRGQSTISQHSTSAGWLSIEKAVLHYENRIQ